MVYQTQHKVWHLKFYQPQEQLHINGHPSPHKTHVGNETDTTSPYKTHVGNEIDRIVGAQYCVVRFLPSPLGDNISLHMGPYIFA
jgi:hypothetical protein